LIIFVCGVWLSALFVASSYAGTFWTWWAIYILAAGIGNGGAYLSLFKISWGWFPDRPGLASGLILSWFGLARSFSIISLLQSSTLRTFKLLMEIFQIV